MLISTSEFTSQNSNIIELTCRACGTAGNFRRFQAREMLFGWRHEFQYGECPECQSLQIERVPEFLPSYYPKDYYSLKPPISRSTKGKWYGAPLANWLVRSPGRMAEFAANRLARKYPFFFWCRLTGATTNASILDVGCGSGGLLRRMQRYGFERLTGCDPYTPIEVFEDGFTIRSAELGAMDDTYSLIMMHHVLEHLEDPLQALIDARDRLAPGGKILVRIPVSASHTWRLYGPNWFNLDPPRHLLVPSELGMRSLAAQAQLRISHVGYDGTEMAFHMSDNYSRDVPYASAPHADFWKARKYRREAHAANRRGQGDQGIFVLEKP